MFNHVMVGANDIEASKEFYDATLGVLSVRLEQATTRDGYSTEPQPVFSPSPSRSMVGRRRAQTAA